MSDWKDALCILAILFAWGLAGHFDYEDAIAMEAAARTEPERVCILRSVAPADGITDSTLGTSDSNAARPTRACATDDR